MKSVQRATDAENSSESSWNFPRQSTPISQSLSHQRPMAHHLGFIVFIPPGNYIAKLVFMGMNESTCAVSLIWKMEITTFYELAYGLFLFQSQRDH